MFVACANQLSLLQPQYPLNPTLKVGRQGPYTSDFVPITSRLAALDLHRHRTEIQNVAARRTVRGDEVSGGEYLVGSVDSYGSAQVSRLRVDSTPATAAAASSSSSSSVASYTSLTSYSLLPALPVEDGWHGVALHPTREEQACVASYTGRSLSIYHGDRLQQQLFLPGAPTSLKYFRLAASGSDALLAVNEGNTLSIWDLRMSNAKVGLADNISKGAVQRMQDTPGDLFALDAHEGAGLLATGGVDKQVTVYDARRWQAVGRWKNVLKYEILSLAFTAHSPAAMYVCGLDHEVYCGAWGNQALNQRNLERMAFRGDARWVGMARTSEQGERGGDQLVGLTQSGQLYVLQNAHLQNGRLPPTATAATAEGSGPQAMDVSANGTEFAAPAKVGDGRQLTAADLAKKAAREQKKKDAAAAAATAAATAGTATATATATTLSAPSAVGQPSKKRKEADAAKEEEEEAQKRKKTTETAAPSTAAAAAAAGPPSADVVGVTIQLSSDASSSSSSSHVLPRQMFAEFEQAALEDAGPLQAHQVWMTTITPAGDKKRLRVYADEWKEALAELQS